MIVSHRYKFVFIAVPRTGSHAIRAALQPDLGPDDWQQDSPRTGRSTAARATAFISSSK